MALRLILAVVLALASTVLLITSASADSDTQTYQLHLEVPNVARAPSGDQVTVTGEGTFSVHTKSVSASGTFTHTDSQGNVLGTGRWNATDLLSFQLYGCGVVHLPSGDVVLPENFCGGKLMLRVLLTAGGMQREGILSVFCIVGANPPNSHDDPTGEGIHLDVLGVVNFNKIVAGMNIYIRTS